MKICVISDTHDNISFFKALTSILSRRELKIGVHCGDHISPFTVEWMEETGFKNVYGVLGNNDGEVLLLSQRYIERGWTLGRDILEIELEGASIGVTHGTYMELPWIMAESGRYDIVLYGHTHEKTVEFVGETLVVNPGEGCGYLKGEKTLAVVDVKKKDVEIISL